jgi:hypothetical protein
VIAPCPDADIAVDADTCEHHADAGASPECRVSRRGSYGTRERFSTRDTRSAQVVPLPRLLRLGAARGS